MDYFIWFHTRCFDYHENIKKYHQTSNQVLVKIIVWRILKINHCSVSEFFRVHFQMLRPALYVENRHHTDFSVRKASARVKKLLELLSTTYLYRHMNKRDLSSIHEDNPNRHSSLKNYSSMEPSAFLLYFRPQFCQYVPSILDLLVLTFGELLTTQLLRLQTQILKILRCREELFY